MPRGDALLFASLCLALAGCGGAAFGGLGDDVPLGDGAVDQGAFGDDASASADVLFPADDGSPGRSDGGDEAGDASDADADGGAQPVLSSNPDQVYCESSGSSNALCPAGQHCCGRQPPLGSWSWSCVSGSCDAPFAGSARLYSCNEKADCGGFLCCIDRGLFGDMNGSHCHSDASPCGDEAACMSDADCPSGQKCNAATAQDAKFTIGLCK
jgi:hypothetical protein